MQKIVESGKKIFKKKKPLGRLHCRQTNQLEQDRELWKKEVMAHCEDKYKSKDEFISDKVEVDIKRYELEAENCRQLGTIDSCPSIKDFLLARAKAPRGKCNGGLSIIVPEILALLSCLSSLLRTLRGPADPSVELGP